MPLACRFLSALNFLILLKRNMIMENFQSSSNSLSDSLFRPLKMKPHPPSGPFDHKKEAIIKARQWRYTHQSGQHKNDTDYLDCREIKSAGPYIDQNSERINLKPKISSASSSRTQFSADYRSSHIKRENSSGLYTFDSAPSVISDDNNTFSLPRTKRKENLIFYKQTSTKHPNEPNLPSLKISKAMRPCKSIASPINSTQISFRINRRSLQQLSKEDIIQLCEKSTQCQSSLELQSNEPINLSQYHLPDDLSESFENRILASLAAQNALESNYDVKNPSATILPHLLTSKDFSLKNPNKITPRTEALIMCGSYSDEESSVTTAPGTNRRSSSHNLVSNMSDRPGMHNEWKHHINCSQDTSKSTDYNSITESLCNSVIPDDTSGVNNLKTPCCQDYLSVHYIPDFGCFYDPKTGFFYESKF